MPQRSPRISDLDHRLVLEYARRTPDGSGGFTTTWHALAEVWADITTRGGDEALRDGGIKGARRSDFVVRARPEIIPTRRFRAGGRIYEIHAVQPHDAERRYLLCRCDERNL